MFPPVTFEEDEETFGANARESSVEDEDDDERATDGLLVTFLDGATFSPFWICLSLSLRALIVQAGQFTPLLKLLGELLS